MANKIFLIKRTLQFLAVAGLVSAISVQFIKLQKQSDSVRYQQTEKFSYSLTNLAAAEASRYLAKNQQTELKYLIDDLIKDPIVRDATIYDKFGQIIYQSKDILPLSALLKFGNISSEESEGVTPYIAELYSEQTKIGYIRVTLEQAKMLNILQDYQNSGLSIIILLILLAFVSGSLLTTFFYRRTRKVYKQLVNDSTKVDEPKPTSFHTNKESRKRIKRHKKYKKQAAK